MAYIDSADYGSEYRIIYTIKKMREANYIFSRGLL